MQGRHKKRPLPYETKEAVNFAGTCRQSADLCAARAPWETWCVHLFGAACQQYLRYMGCAPAATETLVQASNDFCTIGSSFSPLRAREVTGAEIPKNGEKLHNSPPRSGPRKWEKNTENNFAPFWGHFSPFSGVRPGRGIW